MTKVSRPYTNFYADATPTQAYSVDSINLIGPPRLAIQRTVQFLMAILCKRAARRLRVK
jgi:hypothetical protein